MRHIPQKFSKSASLALVMPSSLKHALKASAYKKTVFCHPCVCSPVAAYIYYCTVRFSIMARIKKSPKSRQINPRIAGVIYAPKGGGVPLSVYS
jgi:hypothetical protein